MNTDMRKSSCLWKCSSKLFLIQMNMDGLQVMMVWSTFQLN